MPRMSGSLSPSWASTVMTTWVSFLNPSGNRGRIGRSIRREVGDLLLGRATLALEEAAGDLAGRERLFLIVHREREEALAGLDALGSHGGDQHHGLTHGGEDRAVGLAGDPAALQHQLAAAPGGFLARDIEHRLTFLGGRRLCAAASGSARLLVGRRRAPSPHPFPSVSATQGQPLDQLLVARLLGPLPDSRAGGAAPDHHQGRAARRSPSGAA